MILGDCLDAMQELDHRKFDLMIGDLPYGMTSLEWDKKIDEQRLFAQWRKLRRDGSAAVLFCNLKYMISLIGSNPNEFRYEMIWAKKRGTNGLVAAKRPMPAHEYLAVFGKPPIFYKSIKEESLSSARIRTRDRHSKTFGVLRGGVKKTEWCDSFRHPLSVRNYASDSLSRNGAKANLNTYFHPTQKPRQLVAWIIESYCRGKGEVFDPSSGSASSAVAAMNCGRHITCVEKDKIYFEASVERCRKNIKDNKLDVRIEVRR